MSISRLSWRPFSTLSNVVWAAVWGMMLTSNSVATPGVSRTSLTVSETPSIVIEPLVAM